MDMGIAGKTALVCAASKGLGRACAHALSAEGVQVTITARSADDLEKTAAEIAGATGNAVQTATGDITSEAGREAALAACPAPDILVNNAGGPPAGDFREWDREDWVTAVDANMIAPILLTKAVIDGMIGRKFGRVVNITSYSVKRPLPPLGLSNGARAGLTGFVAGLSRETVKHNVTVNNLLPGPFETDRLTSNIAAVAERKGVPYDEEADLRRANNPAGRFGDPAEFGVACLFLCGAQAGFITGQNLVLDGGETWGTM